MVCTICQKKDQVGYNRPHSQHQTKRIVKPNIQSKQGKKLCTRCMRTQTKEKSL